MSYAFQAQVRNDLIAATIELEMSSFWLYVEIMVVLRREEVMWTLFVVPIASVVWER